MSKLGTYSSGGNTGGSLGRRKTHCFDFGFPAETNPLAYHKETNVKRAALYLGLALAIVALASVAFAAENAITINGGGQTVLMKAPSVKVNQPYRHDPKLKTIYTDLGTGTDVYISSTGWTISGSASQAGELWTQGCAFVPKANHTVTAVKVGFTYVTGSPNSGTIALYSDKGGQPNKALHTFPAVNNLPTFGTTGSVLQTVKYSKGIAVKKN